MERRLEMAAWRPESPIKRLSWWGWFKLWAFGTE